MFKLAWEHWPHIHADGIRAITSSVNARQDHAAICGSLIFPFLLRDVSNGKVFRVRIFALICTNLPLPLMIGEDSYLGRQLARSSGHASCVLSSPDTAATVTVKLVCKK